MSKDFDKWTVVKKQCQDSLHRLQFKERDVWWCKLGVNVGDEQDGKGDLFLRPVLVIKKFNKNVFVGLPLSTVIKDNNSFYHKFKFKGKDQSVIISQIKLIDSKRLSHKLGAIYQKDFEEIKEKSKHLIFGK